MGLNVRWTPSGVGEVRGCSSLWPVLAEEGQWQRGHDEEHRKGTEILLGSRKRKQGRGPRLILLWKKKGGEQRGP